MQVFALVLTNQNVRVFPINIEKFFPNLQFLECRACGLAELTNDVLDGLTGLRVLDLFNNNIQVLGRNLFENNPRIQSLHFGNNPMRHIAHNVFDPLPALTTFHFQTTTCNPPAPVIIDNNRNNILNFIFRLSIHCPPTTQMIQEDVLNGVDLQQMVEHIVSEKLDPITKELWKIGKYLESNDKRMRDLETNIANVVDVVNLIISRL